MKMIKAKDCKCIKCGKQAVAFYPCIDPDIPEEPYCRECLDEIKNKVLMEILGMEKRLRKMSGSEDE